MKNFKNWSKKVFFEWLKSESEVCKKYVKNFENAIDDEDEIDIEAYAWDTTLKSWFRIKDSEDRKHVLTCLKNLMSGRVKVEDEKEAGIFLKLKSKTCDWGFFWLFLAEQLVECRFKFLVLFCFCDFCI